MFVLFLTLDLFFAVNLCGFMKISVHFHAATTHKLKVWRFTSLSCVHRVTRNIVTFRHVIIKKSHFKG